MTIIGGRKKFDQAPKDLPELVDQNGPVVLFMLPEQMLETPSTGHEYGPMVWAALVGLRIL